MKYKPRYGTLGLKSRGTSQESADYSALEKGEDFLVSVACTSDATVETLREVRSRARGSIEGNRDLATRLACLGEDAEGG